MIKVVSGVAIVDGRILMGKRKAHDVRGMPSVVSAAEGQRGSIEGKLRPGLWELPGGKIEAGESPEVALRREWKEELGLELAGVRSPIAHCVFHVEQEIHVVLYEVRLAADWRTVFEKNGSQSMPLVGNANQWWGGFVDHDEVCLVDPMYAVKYLPCSPGFYLHFGDLRDWMRATDRWDAKWPGVKIETILPIESVGDGKAMVSYQTSRVRMESIVPVGAPHTRPALVPPSSFPTAPPFVDLGVTTDDRRTLAEFAEHLAMCGVHALVVQLVDRQWRASVRTPAGVGPVGRGPTLASSIFDLLAEIERVQLGMQPRPPQDPGTP